MVLCLWEEVVMRLLVCGDRDWTDRKFLYDTLDRWHENEPIEVVIEGEARGADQMARDWATARGVVVEPYPADWEKHGKAAGPIRNQQMLDADPDFVLAFHDDIESSKGTRNMVKIARKAGVPASVVTHDSAP